MQRAPDSKYHEALAIAREDPDKGIASDCPLVVLIANTLLDFPVVQNALARAFEIYRSNRNSKIIMESMLFCLEPVEGLIKKVSSHMQVSSAVVKYYANYFFDPTVFVDMFDRLDYLEYISEDDSPMAVKDKVSKQLAMTEGFSFVISHFKGGAIDYSATEYAKRLLSIANKFVARAQHSGIMSNEADKLYKWIQLASKLAKDLEELRSGAGDDALQDIKIALEYELPPKPITALPMEDVIRG